ncbi:MAG: TlpA family protein disulfide reductase [Elusimicrobia bacterium]|nr:TlpA family protein disulfide reductase [Elusimicrobiota bacterium]
MNLKMSLWKILWPIRAWWQRGLEVGSIFPDFALREASGQEHSLSDNPKAKITILWFTNFCEDCRSKIPMLEGLLSEADDRYRVFAVSILKFDNPLPREIASICSFPVLLDPKDIVANKLGLEHPPATCPIHNLFILGPQGRILYKRHLSALGPEAFCTVWRGLLVRQGVKHESVQKTKK